MKRSIFLMHNFPFFGLLILSFLLPPLCILGNNSYCTSNHSGDSLEQTGQPEITHNDLTFFSSRSNAYSKLTDKDFNSGLINDPMGLIEGRVTGLAAVKPGGNPNQLYDARIRGMSNIYGSNYPTIIIDGVMDAQLENVDPKDIASIEILKDVAATAFYGIRGSRGVIVVTTKQGDKEKFKINYNSFANFENAIRKHENMSRDEYVQFSHVVDIPIEDFGDDTNWYDEILQPGFAHVHNLSLSGGNGHTDYYLAANYRKMDGTLMTTGFNRINTWLNLNHRAINDKLILRMNVGATFNESSYGNNGAFKYATIFNPTAPVQSEDPEFEPFGGYAQQYLFDYYNPVGMLEQQTHDGTDKRWNMRLSARYDFTPQLFFDVTYALQSYSRLRNDYESKYSLGGGINSNGLAHKSSDEYSFQFVQTTLGWEQSFSHGNWRITGGYAYQYYVQEGFSAEGGDFITDAFLYNRLNSAADFSNGLGEANSYKRANKIIGFFGMAHYDWKNTYFLSLLGRYDGSSRFGANEKMDLYYGISGAMDFARILSFNKVDRLKLRIGWGKSGQDLNSNYVSKSLIEPTWASYYYGEFMQNYELSSINNPDLSAPFKTEINIGLDFQLFGEKIYGSFDYYSNKVQDLVMSYDLGSGNIVRQAHENAGELTNKGWEFTLAANAVDTEAFTYRPSVYLTRYLENSYGSLSDPENGHEFGERWYGYLGPGCCQGLVKMDEYTDVGEYWGYEFKEFTEEGNTAFVDQNRDGEIRNDDRVALGVGLPDFEFGWANTISFKRWDASLFFKGTFGHSLLNHYRLRYEGINMMNSYNVPKAVRELKSPGGVYSDSWPRYSSYLHEKGNYFKLANFEIGYSFHLQESSAIKKLRLYFMGQNHLLLTNYSGSDPETRYNSDFYFGFGNVTPGFESLYDWLMTRSLALGLNLSF